MTRYYVTNLADERIPFTGIIEMTALVEPSDLGGFHLVYLPWYVSSDAPELDRDDDCLWRDYWKGLHIVHPSLAATDVVAYRLSRVRRVMPIPTLADSRHVPALQTSLPGMYLANSTQIVHGTPNVNETVERAEEAAFQLLADDGPPSPD